MNREMGNRNGEVEGGKGSEEAESRKREGERGKVQGDQVGEKGRKGNVECGGERGSKDMGKGKQEEKQKYI